MKPESLPSQISYPELTVVFRSVGKTQKRYKDPVNDIMNFCRIDPENLENLTADRAG